MSQLRDKKPRFPPVLLRRNIGKLQPPRQPAPGLSPFRQKIFNPRLTFHCAVHCTVHRTGGPGAGVQVPDATPLLTGTGPSGTAGADRVRRCGTCENGLICLVIALTSQEATNKYLLINAIRFGRPFGGSGLLWIYVRM